MARPVIALLTDFGVRDPYVAAMKGVMLGICREAVLVDISHDVPPHDVGAAALELTEVCEYFPDDTIFLCVVDPGVGSSRLAIAAAAGGRRFVAPDNGLLSDAFERHPPDHVVRIDNPRYARARVSSTFEGRDRFGPAAAWLASGVELAELGPAIDSFTRLPRVGPRVDESSIVGEIVRVDRFGNLVTNIEREAMGRLRSRRDVIVQAGEHRIDRVVDTYADAAPGEVCALFGSSNRLEIAVNCGSAAAKLRLDRGAPVLISAAL